MRKSSLFKFAIVFVATIILNSCEYVYLTPIELPDEEISFSESISPIISEQGCSMSGCHKPAGGISPDLSEPGLYQTLIEYVDLETPELSEIYVLLNDPASTHNGRATATQQALILQWIVEGAQNN